MYSNQMGLFLQVSSLDNKYIMVIHNVDTNYLWVEALKNNTGGILILGRTGSRTLTEGAHCPVTPSPGQPSIVSIQKGHWRLRHDL
jgi:hypothetical protein